MDMEFIVLVFFVFFNMYFVMVHTKITHTKFYHIVKFTNAILIFAVVNNDEEHTQTLSTDSYKSKCHFLGMLR